MIGNPYGQDPYAQILQRTMQRMKGLENMGSVAPPQRPTSLNQRMTPMQRPPVRKPQNPYDIQFGSDYGFNGLNTEVRY